MADQQSPMAKSRMVKNEMLLIWRWRKKILMPEDKSR